MPPLKGREPTIINTKPLFKMGKEIKIESINNLRQLLHFKWKVGQIIHLLHISSKILGLIQETMEA